ncbi:hypothetical protein LIER_19301 [Lithospermum erythrorhizon]|uniref:Uncharacterized protein n=1 Tax=Lithospermum erythrorhizon TaxID=34254 RepID=A0AAV3QIC4_LITER
MKMRNKGKVHPSPPLSSPNNDITAILNLLPAAILTLASLLSLQDKEVLAYMITRSLKTTIITTSSNKNPNFNTKNNKNVAHKPPMFDCECFDCYTSYWSRWNSSSKRELIHQAIEAFEEHLNSNNGEFSSSLVKNKGRNKKREKMGRKIAEKNQENGSKIQEHGSKNQENGLKIQENGSKNQESSSEIVVIDKGSPEKVVEEVVVEAAAPVNTAEMAAGGGSSHKGLARKVLPDVLGLFNSRLWSLWGPNV